jgi:feruloyl esterase
MKQLLVVAAIALTMFSSSVRAAPLSAIDSVTPCQELTRYSMEVEPNAEAKITSAEIDAKRPRYCHVLGVVPPAVKFEALLPVRGWTQRYLQTGCGGLCGHLGIGLAHATGCAPITDDETVLATTDTGHGGPGSDAPWGNDPQLRSDFAFRSFHVTAAAVKGVIKAFYGHAPRFSYFAGCSEGGREALIEAQRFPADFDGIAAGAPALRFSVLNGLSYAWAGWINLDASGRPILNPIDLPVLHRAALAACGTEDGVIINPQGCKFDPAVAQCKGEAQPGTCLTVEQVRVAREIYAGPHSPEGDKLAPGLEPGSELPWATSFVPHRNGGGGSGVRTGALVAINSLLLPHNPEPKIDLREWKFDQQTVKKLEYARRLYDADNPDLSPFASHGGKLILYHGWADQYIPPMYTVDYYEQIGTALGPERRAQFVRLYMFPGMFHCGNGEGPSDFPLLAALMRWVEDGAAPRALVAKTVPMAPEYKQAAVEIPVRNMTRPVYAFPAIARYKGRGSPDDAANFIPVAPRSDER